MSDWNWLMNVDRFINFLFLSDGRILFELTHRENGDRGGSAWVPITKKVYWPPTDSNPINPGTVKSESNMSAPSGKMRTEKLEH